MHACLVGADMEAKDDRGMTPLHWAATNGAVEQCVRGQGMDAGGGTPLHHRAAEFGQVEATKLLV
jgi:ankyrin repeat protein